MSHFGDLFHITWKAVSVGDERSPFLLGDVKLGYYRHFPYEVSHSENISWLIPIGGYTTHRDNSENQAVQWDRYFRLISHGSSAINSEKLQVTPRTPSVPWSHFGRRWRAPCSDSCCNDLKKWCPWCDGPVSMPRGDGDFFCGIFGDGVLMGDFDGNSMNDILFYILNTMIFYDILWYFMIFYAIKTAIMWYSMTFHDSRW
jgi:hypothetical protein